MSDERLAAIERKIDRLVTGQEDLRTSVSDLRTGQEDLRTSVIDLRAGQDELQGGLDELRAGQLQLRGELAELRTNQEDLDRHMHVLHEDVIDRIAALPTDVPTRADMHRALADLNESIGRRLDPLEAAVRRLMQ